MTNRILLVTLLNQHVSAERLESFLSSSIGAWGALTPGVDYTVHTGREGDPLLDLSDFSSGLEVSAKQLKMLSWKMGVLSDTIKKVRDAGHPAGAEQEIAREVHYIASVEYAEHISQKTLMTKKRASALIDACFESISDMEYELSENRA